MLIIPGKTVAGLSRHPTKNRSNNDTKVQNNKATDTNSTRITAKSITNMANFVYPEEQHYFIETVRPFQLLDIGSPKWLEMHEVIIKLSQQAILEAADHREEAIKESLITRDKLRVLIHEAYCVFVWKTRILPHLLEVDPNPSATFLIYTVFFHEGAVISLLETALFHVSACEALQDAALDLVDYCAQGVAQVIGLVSMGYHENETKIDVDEAVLSELERQNRDLIYKIGLRCISILNYLADNAKSLPLSATRRMVVTHDIPWLMVDLLHFRPWQKHSLHGLQKYIDEKWTLVQGAEVAKVVKHEAQSWFCLHQLLLNSTFMQSYELNEERRNHLARCQGLLNETVLDQLPPLIELKQYLCRLSMSGASSMSMKKNLVLEEVPEIRENLIKEAERVGGFLEIAQRQEGIFLTSDRHKVLALAHRLNSAYNTDLLAELEQKTAEKNAAVAKTTKPEADTAGHKCGNCLSEAVKKCANCKSTYYCSRKCQQEDWSKHKVNCVKV